MSNDIDSSECIQEMISKLLEASGAMPVAGIPIIRRKPHDKANDIEAALAKEKICLYVMPPFETSASQGTPFLFFEACEIRVRIVEQTQLNDTGTDAYKLKYAVAEAIHGKNPDGFFADIIRIASRPFEMVEDPKTRIIDAVFFAPYQQT